MVHLLVREDGKMGGGWFVCFSLRPADTPTHARQIHEKSPPDVDTKWDRSPLRSLPSTALLSLGGESKASAEAFPESASASARSLDGRPAGRSGRALQSYLCTVMNGTRTRIAT